MKKMLVVNLFFCALFHAFCILPLMAGVPQLINFQGELTDNAANPLNGSYSITFGLWSHQTSTDSAFCQWTETHSSVTVTDGLFNVLLGSVKTDTLGAVFESNDTLYLEKTVGAETLSPRVEVGSLGYAMRAGTVGGVRATDNVFPPFGPVGIGTTDPDPHACLHLVTTTYGVDWREKILLERPEETVSININLEDAWPKIEGTNPDVWWRIGVSDDLGTESFAIWERKGNPMIFGTGGPPAAAERMRITSGGKVGIGTKSPDSQLEIRGAAGQTFPVLHLVEGDTHSADIFKVDSFEEVPLFVIKPGPKVGIGTTNPDAELQIHGSGTTHYTGIALLNPDSTAELHLGIAGSEVGDHAYLYNIYDSDLTFGTDDKERIRIKNDGNVGIGNTSPSYLLTMEPSGGGYYSASDHQWHNGSTRKIKQDIAPSDINLSEVLEKVEIVKYRYKSEAAGNDDAPYHIGFIGEDTPELLSGKDRNSMATGDCIGLLLALVKEQQQKISSLEERLELVEKR